MSVRDKEGTMTRLSTYLRAALIVVLLAIGVVTSGPVAAQDATEPAEETTEQVDQAADAAEDEDDGFDDWGLLGLLGLAGLAGLFRRPKPVVHETERSGFTSASDRIDNRGL
jgi:MYXO-CTERM domain-containing protein